LKYFLTVFHTTLPTGNPTLLDANVRSREGGKLRYMRTKANKR